MKDEIKEKIKAYYVANDIDKILDYITDLQEEIHKKEAMYDSLAVDYRLSQEENERLLKTQKMYEKKCNKIHDYILQNCEIIRHKDYDEIGKVNGRYILFLLNGDDEE